jgi:hypothetical protein
MNCEKTKIHKDALPRDSNGNSRAMQAATRNIAPAIKIGTELVKSAYKAIIGACKIITGVSTNVTI